MPRKKIIVVHPRPYQARPKGDIEWIVLSRDVPTDGDEASKLLPTWSFAACSKVGGNAMTDKTGAGAGLEAILMMLRSSFAVAVYLTKEDWEVLEPELKKPVVPINDITVEHVDRPFAGTAC